MIQINFTLYNHFWLLYSCDLILYYVCLFRISWIMIRIIIFSVWSSLYWLISLWFPISPGNFSMIYWIFREISRKNIKILCFSGKFPGKSRKCVQRSWWVIYSILKPYNRNPTHKLDQHYRICRSTPCEMFHF